MQIARICALGRDGVMGRPFGQAVLCALPVDLPQSLSVI